MFLDHPIYEGLKNVIGPVATAKLAKQYGGQCIYLPKVNGGRSFRQVKIKATDTDVREIAKGINKELKKLRF